MTRGKPIEAGERFGRLVAIQWTGSRVFPSGGKRSIWLFRCDCGADKQCDPSHVRRGKITSCGCVRREVTRARATRHGHGARGNWSPEYTAWANIVARCTNPNRPDFARYGRAGVKVCQEWRDSFTAFLAHIGPRPTNQHSVDRINNERGYEPGNVRWATPSMQRRNQRGVKLIEHHGALLTQREFCAAVGLNYHTYRDRRRRGLDHTTASRRVKR